MLKNMLSMMKLGICLVFLFPLYAQAATQYAVQQALLQASNDQEMTNVIVTFDAPLRAMQMQQQQNSLSTGVASKKKARAALKAEFSLGKKALFAQMNQSDFTLKYEYSNLPQVSMSLNKAALKRLLLNPAVSVSEDKILLPLVANSVPHIFPTHASSAYKGSNKWAVAILDSGIDKTHPFLTGKVVSEACYSDQGGAVNATTSLCPGGANSSTAVGSGVHCDPAIGGCGHGTHLAGIAVGDAAAFDGVASLGKIISIKVSSRLNDIDFCDPFASCAVTYTSDLIAGLQRVYDLQGSFDIAAANVSLGSGSYTGACDEQPEKAVIDLLKSAGIATIVASGNSGNTSQMATPACISSSIAVASTQDTLDTVSSFSNRSTALDLYAPGEHISSSVPGTAYSIDEGTSQAAAHVSGAWAVFRDKNPNISVTALLALVQASGATVAGNIYDKKRIDVSAALAALGAEEPNEDEGLMFPIRTQDGKIVIISL